MQATDILGQLGGLKAVARELGVNEAQAASGAAALLPAILGGFKKQAQAQPTGLDGVMGMVGKLGGSGLLDDVLGAQPTNVARGNDVLGQLFGSKDVSRAVAQQAAGQTGLDPALLKKMLPMLAMLVSGYMAKQGAAAPAPRARQSGGLGGLIGGLMAGGGSATKAPGLAGMLDLNGDGNPLDDILGMMGGGKR